VCNWSIKDSNKFIISVEANDLYYHCGNDSVFCNLSCITVNLLSFWLLTFWKFFEKYKTWKRKKEIYQSCDNLFLKNIHAISFFLSLKNAGPCHFLVGYSNFPANRGKLERLHNKMTHNCKVQAWKRRTTLMVYEDLP
jgi:hypothetical protein